MYSGTKKNNTLGLSSSRGKLRSNRRISIVSIAVIVGLVALVAVSGSAVTNIESGWYASLRLPVWTPAGGVIGAVWTTIFVLTAISAILTWNRFPRDSRLWWIVLLFGLNGLLNVFWSYLWFDQHLLGAALFEMVLLNATTIALVILIRPRLPVAALLLYPYVGWVTFATFLAYTVWRLN